MRRLPARTRSAGLSPLPPTHITLKMYVANVYLKCFRGMLQVFYRDVVYICCNGYIHMLQISIQNVSSTSNIYCKCFI
jgi:hypothetical protein